MQISFTFNNGETAQQIVAAISALFGVIAANQPQAAQGVTGGTHQVSLPSGGVAVQGAVISNADNPATGADPEDNAPAAPAGQTHDAAGVPWDGRIHSSKRGLTDKGLWRKLKGVQDTTIATVMNELRAQGKVLAPQAGAVAAAPVQQAAAPAAPAQMPLPVTALPAGIPQLPVSQPSAYAKFVQFVAENLNSTANPNGRLTQEWVNTALQSLQQVDANGHGSMQALEHKDDAVIKQVHNAFAQALGAPAVA